MRYLSIPMSRFIFICMRILFTILLVAMMLAPSNGQNLPAPMVPKRLVNDFTSLLNEQEQMSL